MGASANTKLAVRLLDFLSRHPDVTSKPFLDETGASADRVILNAGQNRSMIATVDAVSALEAAGVLHSNNDVVKLTETGKARARRARAVLDGAQDGGFSGQHQTPRSATAKVNGETGKVVVDDNESPLSRLRLRKGKDGAPWIDDAAYAAGERLRLDFTCAHLMQKVTSSWDPTSGSRQRGEAGGRAELGDNAIDARARLEAVRRHLGDDLCGVAMDVCCYLKGLQTVERERSWPPRSAKLMLRTALSNLADHYGTRAGRRVG